MERLRFHITGPDLPHKDQRLPWRLVIYEWKETHKGVIGFYSSHGEPMEFETLDLVVKEVQRVQNA